MDTQCGKKIRGLTHQNAHRDLLSHHRPSACRTLEAKAVGGGCCCCIKLCKRATTIIKNFPFLRQKKEKEKKAKAPKASSSSKTSKSSSKTKETPSKMASAFPLITGLSRPGIFPVEQHRIKSTLKNGTALFLVANDRLDPF